MGVYEKIRIKDEFILLIIKYYKKILSKYLFLFKLSKEGLIKLVIKNWIIRD